VCLYTYRILRDTCESPWPLAKRNPVPESQTEHADHEHHSPPDQIIDLVGV
jgi:hypothetical protein